VPSLDTTVNKVNNFKTLGFRKLEPMYTLIYKGSPDFRTLENLFQNNNDTNKFLIIPIKKRTVNKSEFLFETLFLIALA
jgi:hypothetical protein